MAEAEFIVSLLGGWGPNDDHALFSLLPSLLFSIVFAQFDYFEVSNLSFLLLYQFFVFVGLSQLFIFQINSCIECVVLVVPSAFSA